LQHCLAGTPEAAYSGCSNAVDDQHNGCQIYFIVNSTGDHLFKNPSKTP